MDKTQRKRMRKGKNKTNKQKRSIRDRREAKKYIELLVNELGLVDENIIDEFEKNNTKTSTSISSLNNDSSLKLRKKSMDLVIIIKD